MAKQKEMKFRDRSYTLEARRGNLILYLYDDNTQADPESRTYYVVIRYKGYDSMGMSTAGHRHFKLEDAMGLKYTDLLELEVLVHSLGEMGHNVLLGYERGEGWPSGT